MAMFEYFTQYPSLCAQSLPYTSNPWSSLLSTAQIYTPVFLPVPIVAVSPPLLETQLYQYSSSLINSGPLLTASVQPQAVLVDNITNIYDTHEMYYNDQHYCLENETNYTDVNENIICKDSGETIGTEEESSYSDHTTSIEHIREEDIDPVEYYLRLPKDIFPTVRTLSEVFDPNAIIDQFCKLEDIEEHAPWIIDLEFGVPKTPVTRLIPAYNVKYNSIHCKNTLDAVHPVFERCSQDFKREILFYYDYIISVWYIGYKILTHNTCVQNFQSWLLLPMQYYGMCWP